MENNIDDPKKISNKAKGDALEQEVADLLVKNGYKVEGSQQIDKHNVDNIAIKEMESGVRISYLVECKNYNKNIRKPDVEKLIGWLRGPRAQDRKLRGMLVGHGFSPMARTLANENNVWTLTRQELEENVPDEKAEGGQEINIRIPLEQFDAAPFFQERNELKSICEWWKNGGKGICTLVARMGGEGKTALAYHFVSIIRNANASDSEAYRSLRRPHGMFIYSYYDKKSDNKPDLLEGISKWARKGMNKPGYANNTREMLDDLKEYCKQLDKGRLLIILDGFERIQNYARNSDQDIGAINSPRVKTLLTEIVKNGINIGVLITTRYRLSDQEIIGSKACYQEIPVGPLSTEACIKLLRTKERVEGSDGELAVISEDYCGRHALTVDLVANYISRFYGNNTLNFLSQNNLVPSDKELENVRRELPPDETNWTYALQKQKNYFNNIVDGIRESIESDKFCGKEVVRIMEIACFLCDSKRHGVVKLCNIIEIIGDKIVFPYGVIVKDRITTFIDRWLVPLHLILIYNAESDGDTSYSVHPIIVERFIDVVDHDNKEGR